jgi:tRNA dimethylallyltransferase
MKLKNPYMLIIFGPTAVGKTDFSLTISEHFPCEIINMDMGQFYTPLSIGTAKPHWQSEKAPHHLFDLIDAPGNITVSDYRNRLLKLLEEIWGRGALPILVGGSGFYLRSIFFPPSDLEEIKTEIDDYSSVPHQKLWEMLDQIDPVRAAKLYPQDRYRVARALEIWQKTGKKPSEVAPLYKPLAPFTLLVLSRERQELYQRINERTKIMLDTGWIEEVKTLLDTEWEQFLLNKKIIGYNDIISFLRSDNQTNKELLIEIIAKKTRNYAKRQITFWHSLERDLKKALEKDTHAYQSTHIIPMNLTLLSHDLYINQLLQDLAILFDHIKE